MQTLDERVNRSSPDGKKQDKGNDNKDDEQNFENEDIEPKDNGKAYLSKKKLLPTMLALYLVFFLVALVSCDPFALCTDFKTNWA